MEQEKIKKFNTIFPWYDGLSGDLLFWAAIDTLFLTVVKKFNASQIVSLTTVSLITCILLQVPLLKAIRKIGNTNSVKLGSVLLLISSILLTFGQNYVVVAFGKIIYEIAITFNNMANVVLKNNLELQNRNNEYIKIKTKSNTIYATVTMIILLCVSRIVRGVSNITFNDIHKRYKEKVGVILPILLSISILLMILGSFVRKSIEILISMKLYKIIIRGSKV